MENTQLSGGWGWEMFTSYVCYKMGGGGMRNHREEGVGSILAWDRRELGGWRVEFSFPNSNFSPPKYSVSY